MGEPLRNEAELHTADLVFRVGEWDHFRKTHPNWQFAAVHTEGRTDA